MAENKRFATWNSIGTEVSKCNNNLAEILKSAGLDYTVESRPVTVSGIDGNNDRFHAIVRSNDNHVYNIAKKSYTICQNEDAFSLIDQLDNSVHIVRAGETGSGMIYLIGELPEVNVLGDAYKPHLIFQNSHTADFALKSAVVPLRIVCQNQFNVAFKEARNQHTIRHTSSINSQISAANDVMADTIKYMEVFGNRAEELATEKVSVNKIAEQLFPMPATAAEKVGERIEQKRETFLSIYNNDDNQNFKGTAWGVLNAATDYATHNVGEKSNADNRFISSVIYPEFTKLALNALRMQGVSI